MTKIFGVGLDGMAHEVFVGLLAPRTIGGLFRDSFGKDLMEKCVRGNNAGIYFANPPW